MMISMTAFARTGADQPFGRLTWEIRSVNHRYLDVHLKLPEELRALEMPCREKIRGTLGRGRIDAVLKFENTTADGEMLSLDRNTVESLAQVIRQLEAVMPQLRAASVTDILRWPGVISEPALDGESINRQSLILLEQTLESLISHRRREGTRMAELISNRVQNCRAIIADLKQAWPEIELAMKARWEKRLDQIQQDFEPARINQELALLLTKSDISEEVDRLESHLDEVSRVLEGNKPAGRRLDFLMQELNREGNTLGAKSVNPHTTSASVDLKVLIDQMREQVQNIE